MRKTIKVIVLLCSAVTFSTFAAEGGYSNYIPGFYGDLALAAAPEEGFSLRNDVYYYGADTSKVVRNGEVQVDVDIAMVFDYLTVLYNPGIEVLGGKYAVAATLSGGRLELDAGISTGLASGDVSDGYTGFGDLTVSPGSIFWNKGDFHWAWMNYVVIPNGSFDKDELTNTSLNYRTVETDFALTYLNEDTGQDYSIVVGYNYNWENDDTDYQTGDEVHIDFVLNQFIAENVSVGIHGFFLKQVGGDSGDGAVLGDFKAEASGIGPAVMWMPRHFGGKAVFVAKWLIETHAENRLEGDHAFVSFAMTF